MTLMATWPAYAAGGGADLARPSTAAVEQAAPAIKSAVQAAPNVLQSGNIDQAINSVVDAVKVGMVVTNTPDLSPVHLKSSHTIPV